MKRIILMGGVLACLTLASAGTILAQDFGSLLDAVDRLEVDLKLLVEEEALARSQEMAKLRLEMKAMPPNESDVVQPELGPIIAELEYLRQEVALWKSFIDENRAALASLNGGTIPAQDNEQQITELSERLASLSESIAASADQMPSADPAWSEQIQFSGFVDASDFNDHNSGEASFGLDQVEVDVTKNFSDQVALRADIEYVSDGVGGFGMDLEQGYLTYNVGSATSWSFSFGKFNAPIGFELLDAPDMYQYSHALVFDLGIPGNLTGVLITAEFPAVVDWSFYTVNGWDVNTDNNKDKTFGTRVGFTPRSNLNFGISAISGAELDDNNSSRRTVIDWDLTYNPFEFWTIGWELNWGTETKVLADNTSGSWVGFLVMNNWALSDRFAMTTRFDYFNDKNGLRTGDTQKLWAFCWSPFMSIADGLGTLVEVRVDGSSEDTFTGSDGLATGIQFTTAWECTYGF